MSSNQNGRLLNIRVKPSLGKILWIVIPHLLFSLLLIVVMKASGLTAMILIVALLLIIISLIYHVRLHLLSDLKKSVVSIRQSTNNNWMVYFNNGDSIKAEVSGSSFASNLLIIMNVIDDAQKQFTVLITPDSISDNNYRKLKVFLKTRRLKS